MLTFVDLSPLLRQNPPVYRRRVDPCASPGIPSFFSYCEPLRNSHWRMETRSDT
ncbi:hypothetical protein HDG37_002875 [Paraburkholderia sp. MM5384-R2]|nr:hypothetical protein [Paraburkholderia sp. MM5384-R2]